MFRQPEQRILSAYYDDDHNFAAADQDLAQAGHWCGSKDGLPKMPLLDFAEQWRGGMTYQLVAKGRGGVLNLAGRPPTTHHDAAEAARRVREGFAFVGITEMWDLSMCLFHKMFGGACQPSDFEDIRPSSPGKTAQAEYNASELLGWQDDADAVVYQAALDVFHKNLAAFSDSNRLQLINFACSRSDKPGDLSNAWAPKNPFVFRPMRCIWPALLARALLASEDAPLPDDCPSEDPLQLMQRQAAKLVAESNVSEGSFTSRWQGNRETGSWCLIYHCGKHLGPTECHHYRCVCQMGYQYSEMTKRCESESSSPVQRDTGGSCYFWGCARWRGPTECIHHKCMCLEGYRAVRGYCEKHEEPQPMTTTTAPGEGLAVATADPPAMQTSCAWGGQQCGGAGYTGATCCEAGYYCDGAACSKVTEAVEVKQYGFSDKLRKKSSGKLFTFYVYRAQGATTYPPENVNVADLAGVMWYLHNEIVGRADWGYKRKFNITRIIRYKMQTKATQPLIDRGMNFGVRFAFDSGQCTGPFSCDEAWQNYGYFVGCNKLQQGFPFPDFKVAYDGTWYSLPGKCPQMQYFEKTNSSKGSRGLDCLSHQPGGFCEEPSGTADCTYNFVASTLL
eukprot:s3125_g1.t3